MGQNKSEHEAIKKWIGAWESASQSLCDVKIRELRAPEYYRLNQDLLNEMLHYAFENRKVRLTSGLVDMQRDFRKYYK